MDKLQGTEGLQEAAGIAWTEVYGNFADSNGDTHQVKINLTSRADDPMLALANLMATIEFASKEYGLHPWQARATMPVAIAETLPKVEATKVPVPRVVQPEVAVDTHAVETFHACKVDVKPSGKNDGRVYLAFYTDSVQGKTKFPYLNSSVSIDEAVATLGWAYENFEKVATYDMNHNITWKYSTKINSAGNPYKNVTKIEAL